MKPSLLVRSLLSLGYSVILFATPLGAEEAQRHHAASVHVSTMPLYRGRVNLQYDPWEESMVFNMGLRFGYAYTFENLSVGIGLGYHYVNVLKFHELVAPLSIAYHWEVSERSALGVVGELEYLGVVHQAFDTTDCFCNIGYRINHGPEARFLFSYRYTLSGGLAFSFRTGLAFGFTSAGAGNNIVQIGTPLELGVQQSF